MEIDEVKENIQPLRGGRNTERLQTAMLAMDESHQEVLNELNEQRRQFEVSIVNNSDEDPLDKWYEYISWIEQSFLKSGKGSPLDEVILRCITFFEKDERYKQDRRMIKLYIKYIDSQQNPQDFYQELYNQGIGTMCADLYIGWAYYFDAQNNFQRTEEIYKRGLDAHAQPLDELELAHKNFMLTMSQRILYNDEDSKQQFLSSLEQRRNALTSLRAHKKRGVGSVRTGTVVKSNNPGIVNQENIPSNQNVMLQVYSDEGKSNMTPSRAMNESHSIFDNVRKKENVHEPGPWSKAKMGKLGSLKIPSKLPFEILEENDLAPIPYTIKNVDRGIQLPPKFQSKNLPQTTFEVPIISADEESNKVNSFPQYDKINCYPLENCEFSIEEVRAYKYFQKHGINNKFTMNHDKFWMNSSQNGIRLGPNFSASSEKDVFETLRCINEPPINNSNSRAQFDFDSIYPPGANEEFSLEELILERWKKGLIMKAVTLDETMSMDETVIGHRRVSYYPIRHSIIPEKSVNPLQFQVYSSPEKSGTTSNQKNQPNVITTVQEEDTLVCEPAVFKTPSMVPVLKSVEPIYTGTIKKVIDIKPIDEMMESNRPEEMAPKLDFQIFEDSIVSNKQPEFLKPQVPATRSVPLRNLLPPAKLDSEDDAENDFNNPDETCSTQTFNFHIKSQSVSTPKSKKSIAMFDRQTASTPPKFIETAGDANSTVHQIKQLSVIMETTENNTASTVSSTVSSGVNTKSTFDTQMSSPETDGIVSPELPKAITIISEQQTQNILIPITKDSSRLPKKDESINLMVSMKAFDEKTETIPIIPLRKNMSMKMEELFPHNSMTTISQYNAKENNQQDDSIARRVVKDPSFIIPLDDKTETIPVVPMKVNFSLINEDLDNANALTNRSLALHHSKIAEEEQLSHLDFQLEDKTETIPIISIQRNASINEAKSEKNTIFPGANSSNMLPNYSLLEPIQIKTENVSIRNFQLQLDDKTETIPNIFNQFRMSNIGNEIPQKQVTNQSVNAKTSETTQQSIANAKLNSHTKNSSTQEKKQNSRCTILPDELTYEKNENSMEFYDIFIKTPEKVRLPPKENDKKSIELQSINNEISFHTSILNNIKQEKSIHIPADSDSMSFNRKTNSRSSPHGVMKKNKYEKLPTDAQKMVPGRNFNVFEDENINTESFANRLTKAQNSTLLSKEIITPTIVSPPKSTEIPNVNQKHTADLSLSMNSFEMEKYGLTNDNRNSNEAGEKFHVEEDVDAVEDIEKSIYRPQIPVSEIYVEDDDWEEIDQNFDANAPNNIYQHISIDMDQTNIIIMENTTLDKINPFDKTLCNALLDRIDFTNYLTEQKSCLLLNKIPMLKTDEVVECREHKFVIEKLIGRGSYGTIHSGKCLETDKRVALKQERPANLWELYICMELKARLNNPSIMRGFINIEYSIIANNASVFISELSTLGNLIDVCNKVKNATDKKVDEYIGMILISQILSIIDHLHSCNIIHADIKPDNFLLMDKITYGDSTPVIQLIDFGVSIDMKLFPSKTEFHNIVTTEGFTCTEMLDNRPWTYQTDLFGVAGIAHVLLFGQYMQVENKITGWNIRSNIPRYFNAFIWDTFFKTLLNIRDCNNMPNLQHLRSLLEEEIVAKEKFVKSKIIEFNRVFYKK